ASAHDTGENERSLSGQTEGPVPILFHKPPQKNAVQFDLITSVRVILNPAYGVPAGLCLEQRDM
ncbi:MAG TPA: hypothetical protein VH139_07275, partial [Acidobacteriaceae bacterium]|nr:hypothetical protein [Acidobacteriaceae bacterium]